MYDTSFYAVANDWLDIKEKELKESTYARYVSTLDRFLFPRFSKTDITAITRRDLVILGRELLHFGKRDGGGLAPGTVNGILSVMKNILEYAENEKGICTVNTSAVSIKQKQQPMRVLSMAEQKRLCNFLTKDLSPCGLGILFCLYTGLRLGELCALKWSDFSLEEQQVHVSHTMQRVSLCNRKNALPKRRKKTAIIITSPKSSCSNRIIPIPEEIFPFIKDAVRDENTYFLTGTNKYVEPRRMELYYNQITESCGIEGVTFHTLRHSFATRCVELGFDLKSLSEILGHASVNITLNRYVHPSMEMKRRNMNRMAGLLK